MQKTKSAQSRAAQEAGQYKTGLPIETIQQVGRQLTNLPDGFHAHPDVERLLEKRRRMVESADSRVDFAFAELLAFCTLSLRRPKGTATPLNSKFVSMSPQVPRCHGIQIHYCAAALSVTQPFPGPRPSGLESTKPSTLLV
jgi:hypothetical protein